MHLNSTDWIVSHKKFCVSLSTCALYIKNSQHKKNRIQWVVEVEVKCICTLAKREVRIPNRELIMSMLKLNWRNVVETTALNWIKKVKCKREEKFYNLLLLKNQFIKFVHTENINYCLNQCFIMNYHQFPVTKVQWNWFLIIS